MSKTSSGDRMEQSQGTSAERTEIQAEVESQLESAKELAKTVSVDEFKNGAWFVKILQHVNQAYDRNDRATYFHNKYLGLPPDEIADKLIPVATRYAVLREG